MKLRLALAALLATTQAFASIPLSRIEQALQTTTFRTSLMTETAEGLALKLRLRSLEQSEFHRAIEQVQARMVRIEEEMGASIWSAGEMSQDVVREAAMRGLRMRFDRPGIEFLNLTAKGGFRRQARDFVNARGEGTLYVFEKGETPGFTKRVLWGKRDTFDLRNVQTESVHESLAQYRVNVSDDQKLFDLAVDINRHVRVGNPDAAHDFEIHAVFPAGKAPSRAAFMRHLRAHGAFHERITTDVAVFTSKRRNLVVQWSRDLTSDHVSIVLGMKRMTKLEDITSAWGGTFRHAAKVFNELTASKKIPEELVDLMNVAAEQGRGPTPFL